MFFLYFICLAAAGNLRASQRSVVTGCNCAKGVTAQTAKGCSCPIGIERLPPTPYPAPPGPPLIPMATAPPPAPLPPLPVVPIPDYKKYIGVEHLPTLPPIS